MFNRTLAALGVVLLSLSFSSRETTAGENRVDKEVCGKTVSLKVVNVRSGKAKVKYAGASNLWLKGDDGCVLKGNANQNGVELVNCENILVTGIKTIGWFRGFSVTFGKSVEFNNCLAEANNKQGFFTNGIKTLHIIKCSGYKTKIEHAVYISQTSEDLLVKDSSFWETGGSCFQINTEDGKYAKKVRLVGVKVNSPFCANFMGAGLPNDPILIDDCEFKGNKIFFGNYTAGRTTFAKCKNTKFEIKNFQIKDGAKVER